MNYSPEEQALIQEVLAAPASSAARSRYAEWLASTGDDVRAGLIAASRPESPDRQSLDSLLSKLEPAYFGWSRLLGVRLVHKMLELDLQQYLERWLSLARPALELVIGPPADKTPVGQSRLWGDPDLPASARWPTVDDCVRWEPEIDIVAGSPCLFVAQFNLAELANSPAAHTLPATGMLSVFSHHDWDTGDTGIVLRYFEDVAELERTPHAPSTGDNIRVAPRQVELREALTIPECSSSPFASVMGVEDRDWDTSEKHREVLISSSGGLLGLLGHDCSTTGGDPTPDRDWWRLVTVPLDPDPLVIHHLSIHEPALAGGRLEEHRLVWVDFDGA